MSPKLSKLHRQYKSAVLPNLTYCYTVWDVRVASNETKIEKVQEQILRTVYNNETSRYKNLEETRLPTNIQRLTKGDNSTQLKVQTFTSCLIIIIIIII